MTLNTVLVSIYVLPPNTRFCAMHGAADPIYVVMCIFVIKKKARATPEMPKFLIF